MKQLISGSGQRLSAVRLLLCGWAFFCGSLAALAQSPVEEGVGPFRTQTLQLEAGWNAVYLEVEPVRREPSDLFAGTPIEIAAAYFRPATAMDFIDSPSEILPDRKGWSVWYAPERDDALLTDLYVIAAHTAYLLYAKEAFVWELEGHPYHGAVRWHPNAFSLVGFPIDAAEQPTLGNFFAGAKAHQPLKIYRLVGGSWSLVTRPAETLMKPGEAYWTYSQGASSFSGPLTVSFANSSAGGLIFSETSGTRRVEIANVSEFPQQLTFTLRQGPVGSLPVAHVVRALDAPDAAIDFVPVRLPETLQVGPLEPGEAFALDLEVIQDEVALPLMSATLSISSDAGSHLEIPLISVRRDLIVRQ